MLEWTTPDKNIILRIKLYRNFADEKWQFPLKDLGLTAAKNVGQFGICFAFAEMLFASREIVINGKIKFCHIYQKGFKNFHLYMFSKRFYS